MLRGKGMTYIVLFRFNWINVGIKQVQKPWPKNGRRRRRKTLSNKFDSTGRCLQDIEDEKMERDRLISAQKDKIHEVVSSTFENGTLVKEKFYLIHFNILCTVKYGFNS